MKKCAIVIDRIRRTQPFRLCPRPAGCITTGRTVEEIERNIREPIELHLEGLREDGEPIPEPHTTVGYVELEGVR